MPVIRQYNQRFTQETGPIQRRSRSAADFGAFESQAIQQTGQQAQQFAQDLFRRAEQKEVSDLNAKLSRAQAENSTELQQLVRTAQPGDEKVFEDFNRKAQERLDKISSDISTPGGQDYFRSAAARISGSLRVNTARTQAELDGDKAVLDYTSSVNSLSAGLVADPSSFDINLELHNQGIDSLVAQGLLPVAQAAKLKQQGEATLTRSTIRGWARINPEYALQKIQDGDFDKALGGDGKVQMLGEVEQALRAQDVEVKRRERRDKELLDEDRLKTQNEFLEKLTKGDLTTDDVLNSNLEAFGSGSKEQFLRMMKNVNDRGGKLKTNPDTFIELFDRIGLPDGDPRKIQTEAELNEYLGKGLDYGDLNKLRQEMSGTKTERGRIENTFKKQLFKIAKGQLTTSNSFLNLRDPEGDERLLRFQQFAYEEIQEHKAAGKPVKDLFDPSSKDYLGKYIANYKRTPQEIIRSQMQQLQGSTPSSLENSVNNPNPQAPSQQAAPPARQPGESVSQYLERLEQIGAN